MEQLVSVVEAARDDPLSCIELGHRNEYWKESYDLMELTNWSKGKVDDEAKDI